MTCGVWHGEGPCGADGDGTCMLGALTVPALLHGIRLAVGIGVPGLLGRSSVPVGRLPGGAG